MLYYTEETAKQRETASEKDEQHCMNNTIDEESNKINEISLSDGGMMVGC